MARDFATVMKDAPTPTDVHQANAGGGTPMSRRRVLDFRRATAEASRHEADQGGAANKIEWRIDVPIEKTDEDQRLVFGWASVIEENGRPVVDSQGDVISESDLEKAMYQFAEEMGVAGEMHADYGEHLGKLVECVVFTRAKQEALGIKLNKIGAWVGFRLSPELFAKVKRGDYRSFSIGGFGERIANA